MREREKLINIPNTLTLIRIVLSFVFIYFLFNNYSKLWLVTVFSIAAITDWFDGFTARKFNQTSKFGARFDQIADRIFTLLIVGSLFLYFIKNHEININLALILLLPLSREILGSIGLIFILIKRKPAYNVRFIGKLTTFVQSITIGAIILGVSWAKYLVFLTFIIGILAGLDYIRYSLS